MTLTSHTMNPFHPAMAGVLVALIWKRASGLTSARHLFEPEIARRLFSSNFNVRLKYTRRKVRPSKSSDVCEQEILTQQEMDSAQIIHDLQFDDQHAACRVDCPLLARPWPRLFMIFNHEPVYLAQNSPYSPSQASLALWLEG